MTVLFEATGTIGVKLKFVVKVGPEIDFLDTKLTAAIIPVLDLKVTLEGKQCRQPQKNTKAWAVKVFSHIGCSIEGKLEGKFIGFGFKHEKEKEFKCDGLCKEEGCAKILHEADCEESDAAILPNVYQQNLAPQMHHWNANIAMKTATPSNLVAYSIPFCVLSTDNTYHVYVMSGANQLAPVSGWCCNRVKKYRDHEAYEYQPSQCRSSLVGKVGKVDEKNLHYDGYADYYS